MKRLLTTIIAFYIIAIVCLAVYKAQAPVQTTVASNSITDTVENVSLEFNIRIDTNLYSLMPEVEKLDKYILDEPLLTLLEPTYTEYPPYKLIVVSIEPLWSVPQPLGYTNKLVFRIDLKLEASNIDVTSNPSITIVITATDIETKKTVKVYYKTYSPRWEYVSATGKYLIQIRDDFTLYIASPDPNKNTLAKLLGYTGLPNNFTIYFVASITINGVKDSSGNEITLPSDNKNECRLPLMFNLYFKKSDTSMQLYTTTVQRENVVIMGILVVIVALVLAHASSMRTGLLASLAIVSFILLITLPSVDMMTLIKYVLAITLIGFAIYKLVFEK